MLGIGAATEFQVCSARGDRTGANRVFTTALVMAGCAAAVLLAVVRAFATPLASLLGADEATLPLTVTYLRTIFAFAPLFLLNNVLLPFVRNAVARTAAMVAMLVGSFGNIAVLHALFILKFGRACSARRSPRGLLRHLRHGGAVDPFPQEAQQVSACACICARGRAYRCARVCRSW